MPAMFSRVKEMSAQLKHVRMPAKVSIPEDVRQILPMREWKKAVEEVEWDEEDWRTFCEGIGFALWQIARRKRTHPVVDFQI